MDEITENDLEIVATNFRIPKGLMTKIDERAKRVNMSRNAWLVHALSYVIEELPTDAPVEDRRRAREMWREALL